MTDEHCRYVPVVADEKVVAMLSLGDVVNWIVTTQDCTTRRLEDYI